jgi:DNA-binding GntR family transcriptional regulator
VKYQISTVSTPMLAATLAEQAYQELRRRILDAELVAGQRLNVEEIARDLAVSPAPVKEALKQLEAAGLVEIRARRGTLVRSFGASDVDDIYGVRAIIEPAAAASALRSGGVTSAVLRDLDTTVQAIERGSRGQRFRDAAAVLEADSSFHRIIVRSAGNRVLDGMYSALIDQSHLLRAFSLRSPRAAETVAEHRRILGALAKGDEDEAREACVAHLSSARAAVLREIEGRDVREQGGVPPHAVG